ncbi:hypothetical protein, partial [Streptomyces sp. NPDC059455]|uniref:hypothetical protein n=1 Tax=Streptomyces sp. NPDC059455 TaxID=3346837 RepID=UPI00369E8BDB
MGGSADAGHGPYRGAVGGGEPQRQQGDLDGLSRRLRVEQGVETGEVLGDDGVGAAQDPVGGEVVGGGGIDAQRVESDGAVNRVPPGFGGLRGELTFGEGKRLAPVR